MKSDTLVNTGTPTSLNSIYDSEVDNLCGTTVLGRYTLLERINEPSGEAVLYLAAVSANSNKDALSTVSGSKDNHIHNNHGYNNSKEPSGNKHKENSRVVVKLYRRKNAVKDEVLAKLSRLKSPNVVEIIDHGSYNGFPCIVMPYFKNGSLAGKTLSYDTIMKVVIPEVTAGLKYLHDNGIIHKDIKPGNLMVSDDGSHIHIIDFGISSTMADNISILITRTGMSPEYCAPENFHNIWVEESDFYSFGITLYELFKGHAPFTGSSGNTDLVACASIQKIPFTDDFPEELVNLIKGLTYKDLSNRSEKNNPNRRWTWVEIEKWLDGEILPVPGESNLRPDDVSGYSDAGPLGFTRMYDFRNSQGEMVNLKNLSELVEAFGTGMNEGKKHVGRGLLSKFLQNQNMQSAASLVMDCEESGVSDLAYAKMLIELGCITGNPCFYWNSERTDDMRAISDLLTQALFSQISDLDAVYRNALELIRLWYKTSGKTQELFVLERLLKTTDTPEYGIENRVVALSSFINPDIPVKIGDRVCKNPAEFKIMADEAGQLSGERYYEWLQQHRDDIMRYTGSLNITVRETAETLLQDLRKIQERKRSADDKSACGSMVVMNEETDAGKRSFDGSEDSNGKRRQSKSRKKQNGKSSKKDSSDGYQDFDDETRRDSYRNSFDDTDENRLETLLRSLFGSSPSPEIEDLLQRLRNSDDTVERLDLVRRILDSGEPLDIDRNELFRLIMSTDKAREIRDNLKEKLGEGVRSFLGSIFRGY